MDVTFDSAQEYVLIDSITIDENGSNIPTYEVALREKKGLDWTENVGSSSSSRSSSSVNGSDQQQAAGTVTSVGMTVPDGMEVLGSPINSAGILSLQLKQGYIIPRVEDLGAYFQQNATLSSLVELKSAYSYLGVKDGIFFSGATLTGTPTPDLYVDTVNGKRVLYSPLPFITGGDQIVIDGTPGGGGGGGGATTLAGLDDTNITNPQAGQMLSWNGTKWVNTNAPTGSITSVSLAAGASNGTLHLVVNGTAQSDVAVTGLKALAYKDSLAFSEITGTASASQIPTLAISKISGLQTALDGKQPLDADLTAIAGLTGTSGFLKKTAANTWSLDTNTYLTGINSTMVTTALGYTPANVTALSNYVQKAGDTMTGSLTIAIAEDRKLVLKATDAENCSLISFRKNDDTEIGYLGVYGSSALYWG